MAYARINALYTGSLRKKKFLSRGILKFISGAELKWLTENQNQSHRVIINFTPTENLIGNSFKWLLTTVFSSVEVSS